MAGDVVLRSPVHEGVKGTVASRLVGGSLAGMLGFALAVGQAVLQVPLLLQVWSAESFAAFAGVQGLFALLTSADTGFHTFVGAEVNMIGVGRPAELRRLLSSAMRVSLVVAFAEVLICAAGLAGTWYLQTAGVSERFSVVEWTSLLSLSVGWMTVGTLNGLLSRLYLAFGETVKFQLFGCLQKTVVFTAVVGVAWCGGGVAQVSLAMAAASSAIAAMATLYLLWKRPGVFPSWAVGSWYEGWKMARRSLGISLANSFDQVSNGGLSAYVVEVLPATAAANFSTTRTVTNAIAQASGVMMFPTVPEMGRDATPSRIGRVALLLNGLLLVCVTPLAVVVSMSSPWIPELYRIWTRGVLAFDSLMFIALAVGILVRQVGYPFQLLLLATNQVRAQFTVTVVRALVLGSGVAVSWGLGSSAGIAIALAIAEIAVAAYAWTAASLLIRQRGGSLESWQTLATLGHIAVSAGVLAATYGMSHGTVPSLLIGLTAHATILILQLRQLPIAEILKRVAARTRPASQ